MIRWLAFCLLACIATGQVRSREAARVQPARLDGQVLNDFDDRPLRRAHVVLRPVEAGLTAIGAEADDQGNFVLRNVTPGRYTLLATRDGYLAATTCFHGALRMPAVVAIGAGQELTGLNFRLRPWAVLAGKIKFDDGEPAVGVRIDAYREYRAKGRRGYAVAASASTNDRGEYRMHGLQPGSYTIAAVYEKAALAQGYEEQPRVDAEGRELPVMAYTTTFYPNTVKFSEAVPVRLEYGQEVGSIDLFLRLVRKVKLRGQVTSGVTGRAVTTATIILERMDSRNSGTLPAPARATFDRQGRFEIKEVTPGPYTVTAEGADSGKRLLGRALVTVAEQDVDNLELIINAERPWSARVRLEGGGRIQNPDGLRVSMEPRSERNATIYPNIRFLGFQCAVMGDETYDVYVQNLSADFYLSAVRVNGGDVMALGLEGGFASLDKPFEVVLDSRGGRVAGQVAGPDGTAWSGASLMLVPDPPQGRLQSYREGGADEYGQFQIRGVPPGKYVLIAWLEDPPCDYYDSDGLDACGDAGTAITVAQASQENVLLQMKPPPRR